MSGEGNGKPAGRAAQAVERAKDLAGQAQERAREVAGQAQKVAGQARDAARGASDAVLDQTRDHPYLALGAAFGVGYAMGGGLFTPTTARVLRLTWKLAALPPVRDALLDLAEVALDQALAQGRGIVGPKAAGAPAPEGAAKVDGSGSKA